MYEIAEDPSFCHREGIHIPVLEILLFPLVHQAQQQH